MAEHEIVPHKGTVYSVGPRNACMPAFLGNPLHYPVEAVCLCGKRIVRDTERGAWRHEERDPYAHLSEAERSEAADAALKAAIEAPEGSEEQAARMAEFEALSGPLRGGPS